MLSPRSAPHTYTVAMAYVVMADKVTAYIGMAGNAEPAISACHTNQKKGASKPPRTGITWVKYLARQYAQKQKTPPIATPSSFC